MNYKCFRYSVNAGYGGRPLLYAPWHSWVLVNNKAGRAKETRPHISKGAAGESPGEALRAPKERPTDELPEGLHPELRYFQQMGSWWHSA